MTSSPSTDPSTTRIRVAADAGRVRVQTAVEGSPARPQLRPLLLGADETTARVSLVPEGALLLAGDAVRIVLDVGPGTLLDLQEPAGTVAYDMRGGHATWDVEIRLGAGAGLVWHGEPFVVSAGADVQRTTEVTLGAGARLALREVLVLGRHDEPAGRLRNRTEVTGPFGKPVLVEELDVDQHRVDALLGGRRVVETILAVGGEVPGDEGPERLDLDAGGTLLRRMADAAHAAAQADSWDQVVREICSTTSNSIPRASAR